MPALPPEPGHRTLLPAVVWSALRCRQPKLQGFFGPGIVAVLKSTEQGMDVSLVCDGSSTGRGGGEQKDVLPPLMPGLKARQQ